MNTLTQASQPSKPATARKDAPGSNMTTIDLGTHRVTTIHSDFRTFLANLAIEIGQRQGRFSSWMASHLTELAAEARALEASEPDDFDDRRATMAEIAAGLR